jgi:transcriptional regulator with XRE-family HTH domain
MFRDLPNKLADFRIHRKMSQSYVARLIGFSDRQKIARYEQGKQVPRIDRAAQFSSLYGTTVERLFPAVFEAARIDIAERLEDLN